MKYGENYQNMRKIQNEQMLLEKMMPTDLLDTELPQTFIQFGFFGCTTQLARDLSSLTRDLVWSVPTAVEAWSPNHTTAGEFPLWVIFLYKHSSFYCVLLYCTLQIVRFLVGLFVCLFVRTSLMVQWLRL